MKEIKVIQGGKEVKLSLFEDNILYIRDPQISTRNLLEIQTNSGNLWAPEPVYKKSIAFLHTGTKT